MNRFVCCGLIAGIISANTSCAATEKTEASERFTMCGNLADSTYYSSSIAFVDLMKSGTEWRIMESGSSKPARIFQSAVYKSGALQLDANGFPYLSEGRDYRPGTAGISEISITLPGGNEAEGNPKSRREIPIGEYTLIAEGTGKIEVSGGGFETRQLSFNGEKSKAQVKRKNGTGSYTKLKILGSAAVDPLRNIRLIMPGFENTFKEKPFNPQYLELIRPFSKYRLMVWNSVNGSPVQKWKDRTKPSWYSYMGIARQIQMSTEEILKFRDTAQAKNGGDLSFKIGHVPYEVQCQLANQLKRDIWICVPPLADDEYIRQMARLFHEHLDPKLTLTVEYTNESFNPSFLVYKYARIQGRKRWGNDGGSGRITPHQARFMAERMVNVFRIFNEEWGYSSEENAFDNPKRKLRFLMPPHTLHEYANYGDLLKQAKIDHVTEHFYLGLAFPRQMIRRDWLNKDVEFLLGELTKTFESDKQLANLLNVADETAAFSEKHYPVSLICYEGGTHFHSIWWNKEIQNKTRKLTKEMNKHPQVYTLYKKLFSFLNDKGLTGDTYIFTIVNGMFAQKDYPSQPLEDAHRYRACLDYINGEW